MNKEVEVLEEYTLTPLIKRFGYSSMSSILALCRYLEITVNTEVCPYKVNKLDYQKLVDFVKECPDKKERRRLMLNKSRIKNFGSWENWKKTMTDRYKETCLKKYGVENSFQSKEIQERAKQTNLKRYGAENVYASEYGKSKCKETMLERYGVDNSYKLKQTREKAYHTMQKRYGVRHFSQTEIFQKTRFKHYIYNNIGFDSSWELALWIYANDHNIKIKREPIHLEYKYNNLVHYYYPDFEYDGQLVEIKGSQLLKLMTENIDSLDNAKYQCMLENKIKIFSNTEIKPILKYIKRVYGTQYLKTV